jgi:hypothetical protein
MFFRGKPGGFGESAATKADAARPALKNAAVRQLTFPNGRKIRVVREDIMRKALEAAAKTSSK